MVKLFFKMAIYGMLMLLALEAYVRIFHLYTEDPPRFIDALEVEKRVPGYKGEAITGNRRQNVAAFSINQFGYNSYCEFEPTAEKYEIALIGDSFIEGFHQPYKNSLGKKIEGFIGTEVYEFGYTGADMGQQMHMVNAYKEKFVKIDKVIFYMKFENDFNRAIYKPNHRLISKLKSPLYKFRRNCKLWVYTAKIGALLSWRQSLEQLLGHSIVKSTGNDNKLDIDQKDEKLIGQRIQNFKDLITTYGFDKEKFVLLLDSRVTPLAFLSFCGREGISYIDMAEVLSRSVKPTTLIYDMHWNDHGRTLIAQKMATYLQKENECF